MFGRKFLAEYFWPKIFGRKFLAENFWPKIFGRIFLAENFWPKIFGRIFFWPKIFLAENWGDHCQIWTSYWSRTKLIVEVKFGQKSRSKVGRQKYRNGRRYENSSGTEKVELMRTKLRFLREIYYFSPKLPRSSKIGKSGKNQRTEKQHLLQNYAKMTNS